jgi:cell division protein FtsN
MEVNVSEWVAGEESSVEPSTEKDSLYILQVGSFKDFKAADEIKARLALMGIDADIQRVVINGRDVRHRVRVGPYRNKDELHKARKRLQENNLDYMLLKLQVDDI